MNTVKLIPIQVLRFKLVFALLALLSGLAHAAEIKVSVDRNPVSLNESFQLVFSSNDSPDSEPDFSPLDADFSVESQSSGSNISIVNGQTSNSYQWTLTVMAKKAGSLVIPAIHFGKDSSQATTVMVTADASSTGANTDEDLFVDVEASTHTPYVQSQLIYTVRIFTKYPLGQGRLSEPGLSDAVVKKLGEEKKYAKVINGVNYNVIEINYAIFPQKSGKLTIKPMELTAELYTQERQNFNGFPFFGGQQAHTKRVTSKEITLEVKPAPLTFTGNHWLSAEEVEFVQQWSSDFTQMKVGEPITRTLSMRAKGTAIGQLPELNAAKTDDSIKSYPDQPVLKEQTTDEGLVATKEEKIALIPSKPGSLTLPAIEIPWFNTKTQKMEVAKIPETTVTVTGAAAAQPQAAAPVVKPAPEARAAKTNVETPALETHLESNVWLWVSVFLGAGWLFTLVYFLRKRITPVPAAEDGTKSQGLKSCIKNLKAACLENNAQAAKEALLAWGQLEFSATSLGAIALFCDAPLQAEILALNETLYGKDKSLWQGKNLLQAFSENKVVKKSGVSDDTGLEPLYRL